jgi:choline dehydrogenase-like flavoprotein
LFAVPALKQFVREQTLPGPQIQTDNELLDCARRYGGTCYHASCTCMMMGSHPLSVVDSELRVHGLDGLRVIGGYGDSLLTYPPTLGRIAPARARRLPRRRRLGDAGTDTNAPSMMIAENGAAMVKDAAAKTGGAAFGGSVAWPLSGYR